MNEAQYQKLKQVIQQANLEIMELKFGCEILNSGIHFMVVDLTPSGEPITVKKEGAYDSQKPPGVHLDKYVNKTKILGRPIRLADVLLAIKEKSGIDGFWIKTGNGMQFKKSIGALIWEMWNLQDDNLDHQSDECKEFLIRLLASQ